MRVHTHKHTHTENTEPPAECIDGRALGHRHKWRDTQRHTDTDVRLCPFLCNLLSYGSCSGEGRVAGQGEKKNVPPFVLTNKHDGERKKKEERKKKHNTAMPQSAIL